MDFAPLAGRYDDLRPAGRSWSELAERTLEALAGTTRLLDVGCGTGRFAVLAAERLGVRVWGVDPSPEMLSEARARAPRGFGWKQASAEQLPFKSGWFDGLHMHLVLHVLSDLDQALGECARVLLPGGTIAAVTFELEHFDRFHLNPYFPSLADIDRSRFPAPADVCRRLGDAGFADVRSETIRQRVEVEPQRLVERVQGRYISTLHLLGDVEYRRGVERLEHDLEGRTEPVRTELIWSLITGRRA
jgi:ubiquinone/menaquinone biosynthesis C-methylase UbiE